MTELSFLVLFIGGVLMLLSGAFIAFKQLHNSRETHKHFLGYSMCGGVIVMASLLFLPPISAPLNTIEAMGTAAGSIMIYFLMLYQSNMKYPKLVFTMLPNIGIGRFMSWMTMAAFISVTVMIAVSRFYPAEVA